MLEGTTAKTRDGQDQWNAHGPPAAHPALSCRRRPGNGLAQRTRASQLEALAPAVQTATLPRDPRLVRTGAATEVR